MRQRPNDTSGYIWFLLFLGLFYVIVSYIGKYNREVECARHHGVLVRSSGFGWSCVQGVAE